MVITQADPQDFEELMNLYYAACDALHQKDFFPDSHQGVFPTEEMVRKAMAQGQQFVGIEDARLACAYILNYDCDPAYAAAPWTVEAKQGEYAVLHALRVLPDYVGNGFSKKLIQHALDTARSWGVKSVRLDVMEGNSAEELYRACGFTPVDTVEITYPDIGLPIRFRLLECAL